MSRRKPFTIEISPSGDLPRRAELHEAADRALLAEALRRSDNNLAEAARRLGISQSTAWHIAVRLGLIEPKGETDAA